MELVGTSAREAVARRLVWLHQAPGGGTLRYRAVPPYQALRPLRRCLDGGWLHAVRPSVAVLRHPNCLPPHSG